MTKKTIAMPSTEDMRARFAELEPQLAAYDKELAPLQVEQAEIANYRRDDEVRINMEIKKISAKRALISEEMSIIARALGGRTGASN